MNKILLQKIPEHLPYSPGLSVLFSILLLFCMPLLAMAEESDRSSDREQLKQLLYSVEESLNQLDMERLISHFDERAVVSFMTTEVATGRQGILSYYNKMFNQPDAPLASYQTKASLDGPAHFHGDTIVALGYSKDRFVLADGHHYDFNTRWLATAVKKEGQWQLVALDFSVDPFDNVVLDEISARLTYYVPLAFLAGLITLFIIFRLFYKNADNSRD